MDCEGCVTFGCVVRQKLFDPIGVDDAWLWLENHGLTYKGWMKQVPDRILHCPTCKLPMRDDLAMSRYVCTGGRNCRKTLAHRAPYASGKCDARSLVVTIIGIYVFGVESKFIEAATG